jgi:hypothetical protein
MPRLGLARSYVPARPDGYWRRVAVPLCVIVMLCFGAVELAWADPAPDAMQAALLRQYPKGTFKETEVMQLNGVSVHDFEIITPSGDTFARLTPNGDFLNSGRHIKGPLPPPVAHVVNEVLRTAPAHVQRFTATRYLVDVSTGGKTDRLIFDAVGRLRDVKTSYELAHGAEVGAAVDDSTVTSNLADLIHKDYGDNATIMSITHFPNADNFYDIEFTNEAGRPAHAVADDKEVYISRTEIDPAKLPGHVRKALDKMFNSGQIVAAYRRKVDYFQFNQTAPNGDTITYKVAGDGEVESVRDLNEKAEESAMPN